MEPRGNNTLVQEISESHTDGNQTVCGENIALETISSGNKNGGVSNETDKKSPTPDIEAMANDNKYSSFVNGNNNIRHKLCMAVLFLCATLSVIGVMQIPITLFYTDPPSGTVEISRIADFESCQMNSKLDQQIRSSTNILAGVCQFKLNKSTDLFNNCSNIASNLNHVYSLGAILQNDRCVEDGVDFFCDVIDFLCDGSTNSSLSLSEECVQIRDNQCAGEWRVVENFLNLSLPDCSSFDEGANLTVSITPQLPCPDDFGVFCGLCLPICGRTFAYSDSVVTAYNVWQIITLIIGLTGGVITLIASIVKHTTMFHYPLIYVIYGTVAVQVTVFILSFPVLIGSSNLFCSHDSFLVAANPEESTVFCKLQGFVLLGGGTMFVMFWTFHVVHVFSSLAFPFKFEHWLDSKRFRRLVYVGEMTVILISGFVSPTIVSIFSDYKFAGFPLFCVPSSGPITFYLFLLPLTLVSTISLCLLFASFWILRKNYKKQSNHQATGFSLKKFIFTAFSVAEIKLLIVFCYFWLTTVLLTNAISFQLRNFNAFVDDLSAFVVCTAGGYSPECEPIREMLMNGDANINLALHWIAFTLFACTSWAYLFFVIQVSDLKTLINTLFEKSKTCWK